MDEFYRWVETAKEWLIANGDWLGPLFGIVAATAAVIALRPVLFSVKSGKSGGGHSVRAEGSVGPVAQAGDGGTATVNVRDPLDRETIAALLKLLQEKNPAPSGGEQPDMGLEEQIQNAVLGLDRVGAEQDLSAAIVDEAKRAIARGDTSKAEALYRKHIEYKRAEERATHREMAESYRSLGALAFLHDTEAALGYYREATQLDPEDPEGWNQLGHLQHRVGGLEEAASAYGRVLELADSSGKVLLKAVAYGNLGIVYQTRGELDRAVEMYEKSLEINEALGRKEGMASAYGNLGAVYQTRGEPDRAKESWRLAVVLFTDIGSPNAAVVQSWLDGLDS